MTFEQVKASKAYWSPGDVTLLCSGCESPLGLSIEHSPFHAAAFSCANCGVKFALTIERREDQVCLMWQWL